VKAREDREVARADSLLADVRNAVGRAERLYGVAEDILGKALEAEDLKTALNAIRAAADVMAEARQYMELRGELTGELRNVADAAANVPMIVRVLSVPRMPGVRTIHPPAALEPPSSDRVESPAAETTEAVRSLPAAEVDTPVDCDTSDIPVRIAVEGRRYTRAPLTRGRATGAGILYRGISYGGSAEFGYAAFCRCP
jgi:hypothetical protein